jgi:hypothetical protein
MLFFPLRLFILPIKYMDKNITGMDNSDSYITFNRCKRTSMSSVRSSASCTSPYEPASDFLSFNEEPLQRRPSKKGVSTFISKLYT